MSRPRVARGHQPQFHGDKAVDDLLAMIAALAGEVAVLRERLDTHERLAQARGVFSRADVEAYEPDAEAVDARTKLRREIVENTFRVLRGDATPRGVDSYDAVVGTIEGGRS